MSILTVGSLWLTGCESTIHTTAKPASAAPSQAAPTRSTADDGSLSYDLATTYVPGNTGNAGHMAILSFGTDTFANDQQVINPVTGASQTTAILTRLQWDGKSSSPINVTGLVCEINRDRLRTLIGGQANRPISLVLSTWRAGDPSFLTFKHGENLSGFGGALTVASERSPISTTAKLFEFSLEIKPIVGRLTITRATSAHKAEQMPWGMQ
jgi:hypothetical protein